MGCGQLLGGATVMRGNRRFCSFECACGPFADRGRAAEPDARAPAPVQGGLLAVSLPAPGVPAARRAERGPLVGD